MTDWLPTYNGQSQAVHVEEDSEDKTMEPLTASTEGDAPVYYGVSRALNIDISSPDWILNVLGYIFDGPHYSGVSPAIHVRGSEPDWPPVDPIPSCNCDGGGGDLIATVADDFARSVERTRPAGYTQYRTWNGSGWDYHDEPLSADGKWYENWKDENVLLAIAAHFAMNRYNINTNDPFVNYGGHWGDVSTGTGTWTSPNIDNHLMQGVYDGAGVIIGGSAGGYAYVSGATFEDGSEILLKWRGYGLMARGGLAEEPRLLVCGHFVDVAHSGTGTTANTNTYDTWVMDEAWKWTRAKLDGTTFMARTWYDGDTEPTTWDVSEVHALDADISGWTGVDLSHVSIAAFGEPVDYDPVEEFAASFFPYGEMQIESLEHGGATGGIPTGVSGTIDEFDRTIPSGGWGTSSIGDEWTYGGVSVDGAFGRSGGYSGGLDVAGPNHADLAWGKDAAIDILVRYRFVNEGGDDMTYVLFGLDLLLNMDSPVILNSVTAVHEGLTNEEATAWRLAKFSWTGTSLRGKSWRESGAVPVWDDEAADPESIDHFDGIRLRWMGSNGAGVGIDGSYIDIDWIRVDDGSCEDCRGYADFTPGYMPIFRPQIGDPTTSLDGHVCLLESAAMALDWHTRGAIQVWGGELVPWTGLSESYIAANGTTFASAAKAWQHYDQQLDVRNGQTWAHLLKCLDEGRAVVLGGDYDSFNADGVSCQTSFTGNHGIIVLPIKRKDKWLVGDPLCDDFKPMLESQLQAYAEMMGAAEFGASSPQPIFFAVTKKWLFGAGTGEMIWPVRGYVTQEYGCTGFYLEPPRGGCAHFHSGIDIATNYGTPIVAPANGVISYLGWSTTGSWMVAIEHGGGRKSTMGHMIVEHLVSTGDIVRQGDVIGHIGLTGNTTGPHTHWTVYEGEDDVNPRNYVKGNPQDTTYPQSGRS